MEMERFDSRIRGAQFAYDQGLHAYKKLLSQPCYKTFKCGDLVAVEKMSQLMAERLQQQHAVIKSLLYFLAAQRSESVPGTFLPTVVDFTLETETNIQKGIESAIKRIETTRCQARIAHALRSRLVGRDLSMLDLPNETLLNIIEFVSHKSIPICQTCTQPDLPPATNRASWDTESIQSLRLVCRHLSNLSSRFLAPVLSIRTDPYAMGRLEEVSRHPFISKGVRYLDIGSVGFSKPKDLDEFALACHEKLEDMETKYRRLLRSYSLRSCNLRAPYRWQAGKLQELQIVETLISGLQLVQTMEDCRSTDKVWTNRIISMAYEKYQQRHLHHRSVVETGAFAEAVRKAEARMPLAKSECVADKWCLHSPAGCSHCHSWFTMSSEPEDIAECLVKILERSMGVMF